MGMTGMGKCVFWLSWQYLQMDCNTNKCVVGVRVEQKSIMTTLDQLDSFTKRMIYQMKEMNRYIFYLKLLMDLPWPPSQVKLKVLENFF